VHLRPEKVHRISLHLKQSDEAAALEVRRGGHHDLSLVPSLGETTPLKVQHSWEVTPVLILVPVEVSVPVPCHCFLSASVAFGFPASNQGV